MAAYPSKGRGRTPPSAALPISALQRARARNSACKEPSRRERHSTDAYSDSDQSAQPRERASIYRLFSALLAKEPSAEFLAQAANLAPAVQGDLGGILRVASRQRYRAGARRCGVRFRSASAQHVAEPRDRLRVGLHQRRGAFDAGCARCGLYRGLASSLSQFLAPEREDFNL